MKNARRKERKFTRKKKIDFFNSENVSKFYYILNLYKFKKKDQQSYPFLQSKSNFKVGRHYEAQRVAKRNIILIYEKAYIRKEKANLCSVCFDVKCYSL
jgi:hypothetical protein